MVSVNLSMIMPRLGGYWHKGKACYKRITKNLNGGKKKKILLQFSNRI